MAKKMLVNTINEEESRMAIIEDGKLTEFNIKMSEKEPITGNIFKGIVQKVEKGLRAAFVNFGGNRNGFLPLRDVSAEYLDEGKTLSAGRELPVQVMREAGGTKGAMLTTYISLPGRYLVIMPNRKRSGISRKIEDEGDRKRLKSIMDQITKNEDMHFIVRTAGINRTKQELSRDYQMLLRLWEDIKQKTEKSPAPAVIYQESDFAVRSFRDYYVPDIKEILVDHADTFKKMRAYCKAVSPRNVKMIKLYKGEVPIFDKYNIESQIDAIYQGRVQLKSGGYLIITPTEAMITIDVNSGRSSKTRNIEETAVQTNTEAAMEIARQLRLRDLGGLIVIDFIDMIERNHIKEVESTFKDALSEDRARIKLARISKFGILELSRQKKKSTIQEVSYSVCPHCKGSGLRPSTGYLALSTFRKLKLEAIKRNASTIKITIPYDVSEYLLNQKRKEIDTLENLYGVSIQIAGSSNMFRGESNFEVTKKQEVLEQPLENGNKEHIKKIEPSKEGEVRSSRNESFRKKRRYPPRRVQKKESVSTTGEEKVGDDLKLLPYEAQGGQSVTLKLNEREEEEKRTLVDKIYKWFK